MSLYTPIERWNIPSNALPDSINAMASDGRHGNEGIVLWLGHVTGEEATITHLVTLPERWVRKTPQYLEVSPDALSALLDIAEPLEVSLLGQIHSHPGTYVDLSIPDRRYGISAPYYLSVVAPYYAQRPETQWAECGVHQYMPGFGFNRLSQREIPQRVRVIETLRATSIALEK